MTNLVEAAVVGILAGKLLFYVWEWVESKFRKPIVREGGFYSATFTRRRMPTNTYVSGQVYKAEEGRDD